MVGSTHGLDFMRGDGGYPPAPRMSLDDRRRSHKKTSAAINAIAATPPTTPPAIAPAFAESDADRDGECDEGIEDPVEEPGANRVEIGVLGVDVELEGNGEGPKPIPVELRGEDEGWERSGVDADTGKPDDIETWPGREGIERVGWGSILKERARSCGCGGETMIPIRQGKIVGSNRGSHCGRQKYVKLSE